MEATHTINAERFLSFIDDRFHDEYMPSEADEDGDNHVRFVVEDDDEDGAEFVGAEVDLWFHAYEHDGSRYGGTVAYEGRTYWFIHDTYFATSDWMDK